MSLFSEANDGIHRKPAREEMDLDITPMIDVTFLLLIFFMVSSTMQANKDREVPPARHGVGVDTKGAAIIDVLATDGDPQILVGGKPSSLDGITPFVEERVKNNVTKIIVKAEGNVTSKFVQEVLRKVAEVEGADFSAGVRDPAR